METYSILALSNLILCPAYRYYFSQGIKKCRNYADFKTVKKLQKVYNNFVIDKNGKEMGFFNFYS